MATLTYGLTAQENLLALFVAKNPSIPDITPADVTFGTPTEDLTLTGGRNTKVLMTAVEGSTTYSNSKELHYRRLTLTEAIAAVLPAEGNVLGLSTVGTDGSMYSTPIMFASAPTQAEALTAVLTTVNIPEAEISVVVYTAPSEGTPGRIQLTVPTSTSNFLYLYTGTPASDYLNFQLEIDSGNLALASGEMDGFDPVA